MLWWSLLILIPLCCAAVLVLVHVHYRGRSSVLVDRWAADLNYNVVEKTIVRVRSPLCIAYQATLTNQNGDLRRALVQCSGWRAKLDVFWTYFLHIQRRDGSGIALDEWCSAVKQTAGVRLMRGGRTAVNPATGAELLIRTAEPGDTEVFFPDTGVWEPRFGWLTPERISLAWSPEFDQPDWPVRQAALRLASALDAELVGDEGEKYSPL